MEGLQGDDGSGCLLPAPSSQEDGEASHGYMARGGEHQQSLGQRLEKACLVSEHHWAVLGDILVGGYLLEVNSTRGLRFNANEAKVIQGPAGSLLFPLCRAPLSAARPLTDAGGGGMARAGSFSQTDGSPAVCADG